MLTLLIKVVLSAFCLFFVVGFGLCSLAGIALSFENPAPGLLGLALLGVGLTALCAFAVYRIWRPRSQS